MGNILDYMAADHSHCDELFTIAENFAADSDWGKLETSFQLFKAGMEKHFQKEESLLFPGIENQMQSPGGPTQVMRMEHQQMRELMENLSAWIEKQDQAEFLGEAETILIMMQQHNMKEEQILYPMIDQLFGSDAASVIEEMEQL